MQEEEEETAKWENFSFTADFFPKMSPVVEDAGSWLVINEVAAFSSKTLPSHPTMQCLC